MSFIIETECAQCRQPLRIKMDSALAYWVLEGGAEPLVYAPLVNLQKLAEPSIIDSF